MSKRKTLSAPGKHAPERRRTFQTLAALALMILAAVVFCLLDVKDIPQSVDPDIMNENLSDTSDTVRMERFTPSLDADKKEAELQREENSAAHEQTDTDNTGLEQSPAPETDSPASQGNPSADDWSLLLVNAWNALPNSRSVTLTELKNGQSVDERCYPDLQALMDDCRAAGLSPVICSSYRSQANQETLFDNKVNRLIAQGYSKETAKIEAGKSVAVPGTSEHQLGLAVDIVDINNQNLNETQEDTPTQKWLMENSWKYGFILRYPSEKSDITGIIYEPWHYRYVGKDAAKEIYEQGICLEEYLIQQDT